MPEIREDMAHITVSVGNENDVLIPAFDGASWYSVEGGNLESDDSKTRAGGMGVEKSLGGPSSRDDVTCKIQVNDTVINGHKLMELRVQQDAPVTVAYQFLDRLKRARATTHTVVGTLKSAFLPDFDTGSSDAAMYSIIVSCDEQAT